MELTTKTFILALDDYMATNGGGSKYFATRMKGLFDSKIAPLNAKTGVFAKLSKTISAISIAISDSNKSLNDVNKTLTSTLKKLSNTADDLQTDLKGFIKKINNFKINGLTIDVNSELSQTLAVIYNRSIQSLYKKTLKVQIAQLSPNVLQTIRETINATKNDTQTLPIISRPDVLSSKPIEVMITSVSDSVWIRGSNIINREQLLPTRENPHTTSTVSSRPKSLINPRIVDDVSTIRSDVESENNSGGGIISKIIGLVALAGAAVAAKGWWDNFKDTPDGKKIIAAMSKLGDVMWDLTSQMFNGLVDKILDQTSVWLTELGEGVVSLGKDVYRYLNSELVDAQQANTSKRDAANQSALRAVKAEQHAEQQAKLTHKAIDRFEADRLAAIADLELVKRRRDYLATDNLEDQPTSAVGIFFNGFGNMLSTALDAVGVTKDIQQKDRDRISDLIWLNRDIARRQAEIDSLPKYPVIPTSNDTLIPTLQTIVDRAVKPKSYIIIQPKNDSALVDKLPSKQIQDGAISKDITVIQPSSKDHHLFAKDGGPFDNFLRTMNKNLDEKLSNLVDLMEANIHAVMNSGGQISQTIVATATPASPPQHTSYGNGDPVREFRNRANMAIR